MKFVFLCLGHLFVLIGLVGAFLPLLPTTPFLLLAAGFYARSSESFHQALLNNRWCGKVLQDWQKERAISQRTKIQAIFLLWIVLGSSMVMMPHTIAKGALCVLGIFVTIFLFSRRTTR